MNDDAGLRQAYARLVAVPRRGERSTCTSAEELLAVVERDGPEHARLATMEHVMQCAACRTDLELLRAAAAVATEAAGRHGGASTIRSITRPPRFPMRAIAVAAGIVFVVGVGIIARDGGDDDGAPRLRSGGRPQIVLAPPVLAADGSVLLQWQSVPNAVQYRIDVFDAAGRTVSTAAVRDTAFTLAAPAVMGDSLKYIVTAVQADASEVFSSPALLRP